MVVWVYILTFPWVVQSGERSHGPTTGVQEASGTASCYQEVEAISRAVPSGERSHGASGERSHGPTSGVQEAGGTARCYQEVEAISRAVHARERAAIGIIASLGSARASSPSELGSPCGEHIAERRPLASKGRAGE